MKKNMNKASNMSKKIAGSKGFCNCVNLKLIKHVMHLAIFFLLCLSLFIFDAQVKAQTQVDGAFTGLVFAVNGNTKSPIPNTNVRITSKDTGLEINVQTDENGRYLTGPLPPGEYTVEVEPLQNFQTPSKLDATLYATERIHVLPDFNLVSVDSITKTINTSDPSGVTSTTTPPTPKVEPTTGSYERGLVFEPSRGGVFTNKEVTNLPLGGVTFVRSFDELAFLVPGVAPPPQAIGNSVGPGVGPGVGTSGQFSVNGLRSRANNFMVDGSDNNDEDIGVRRQGFFSLTPQPIESIQEFRIITLLAPAQFGRNLGGQVNVLSKSGGKDFHGTLYTFFNSDRFNARDNFDTVSENKCNVSLVEGRCPLVGLRLNNTFANVFDTTSAIPRQFFTFNESGKKDTLTFFQGGGTLGGPIVTNKVFFFVSAEGQLLNASKETHFAVPTVEQRGFRGTGAEGIKKAGSTAFEFFPTTVLGDYILGLFPFPNDPTGLYGRNTYTRVLPASARGRVLSGRFDYRDLEVAGKKQVLTARYDNTDDWRDLQQVGGAVFSSIRPMTRTDNFSTYLTGPLSSSISNVLRFSWGRTRLNFDENKSSNTETYLGRPTGSKIVDPNERRFLLNGLGLVNNTLPGSSNVIYRSGVRTIEDLLGPVGQVNIFGFSPLGVDVFNFPQKRVNNTYQFADTLLLNTTNHNFTFGTDIRHSILDSELPRNSRLLITSSGGFLDPNYTDTGGVVPRCNSSLPNSYFICAPNLIAPIDLIAAGAPTGIFQSLIASGNNAQIKLGFTQLNFFAQDEFRITPKFTLSCGLRYELNTVPKEADKRIENSFNLAPNIPASLANGLDEFLKGRSQIYDSDWNNLAPRIGFAYELTPSTVIRGGYGIYYDQILGAVVSQSRNVFPTFTTLNLAGGQSTSDGSTSPYNIYFCPNNATICDVKQRVYLIKPGTLNTFNPNVTQQQLFAYLSGANADVRVFPNAYGATIPQKELDTPFSQQYSIGFDQQIFSKKTVLSIAYVGTTGRNLLRFTTPNLGRNNILSLSTFDTTGGNDLEFTTNSSSPTTSNNQGRRIGGIGPIDQFETTGRSQYNSLQFQLRGRLNPLNQNLQYQFSYTLASAKDDASDVFDLAGSSALPQSSVSFAGEYAPSNFDVRHRFTYNFIYDLPSLNNQNKLLQYTLGGWQIIGTGRYNTGQPFTVNTIYDINKDGNPTDRLNIIDKNIIQETGSRHRPIKLIKNDAASLASLLAPVGSNGSVPRNSFRAGNVLDLDMSINKNFLVREAQNLLLRVDVFNFINRANFGIPVRFLEAPNFGQAVETITPGRRVQIALKYIF